MKKQTLLLIGLGIVLVAMAKKKEKQGKSKNSVIVHHLEGGHIQTVFESLFNKKPTKNEASQIVNNWKGFNPFN